MSEDPLPGRVNPGGVDPLGGSTPLGVNPPGGLTPLTYRPAFRPAYYSLNNTINIFLNPRLGLRYPNRVP